MGWNPQVGPSRRLYSRDHTPLWRLVGCLVLMAAAFAFGYQLTHRGVVDDETQLFTLREERDRLLTELTAVREQARLLEHTQHTDLETAHLAQTQLQTAQQERETCQRQVEAFEQLAHANGFGIAQVEEFYLWKTSAAHQFNYRFTIKQLIDNFGESKGRITVTLVGHRANGASLRLTLAELTGSKPNSHWARFDHFQQFSGSVLIPADFTPQQLAITLDPTTKNLLALSTAFAWTPADNAPKTVTP
ncbi:DUF6776 family protein [Thiospirillum jenense]|uniref:Uncharacterized protein n=1 Tax=Thiospirillum jenense TaxID=1653858 RepID=A0A839HK35_9GAMM|nr:DUF6776 family protein [Thiospirillum jenense]MBB1127246.1 hypothetical protein [Thiospirillum jenense]